MFVPGQRLIWVNAPPEQPSKYTFIESFGTFPGEYYTSLVMTRDGSRQRYIYTHELISDEEEPEPDFYETKGDF